MHGRSRMTTDPRIPTMPRRSMSGFHQPGKTLLAPSAKRREVFVESHEGGGGVYTGWFRCQRFRRVSLLFTKTDDPGRGCRKLWIARTEGAVGFGPPGIGVMRSRTSGVMYLRFFVLFRSFVLFICFVGVRLCVFPPSCCSAPLPC